MTVSIPTKPKGSVPGTMYYKLVYNLFLCSSWTSW